MRKGFQPVLFPCLDGFSILAKLRRTWFLFKTVFSLPAGALFVIQFPVYPRLHQSLVRLLARRKQVNVICFIADIDGLKTADAQLLEREKTTYRSFQYFIVHNEAMEQWIRQVVPGCRVTQIGFFDFLTTPVVQERRPSADIVFAGNLAKSRFLWQLEQLQASPLRFLLYGPYEATADRWPANTRYEGVYEPYRLPAQLAGSYGLVWDGDSIEQAGGPLGDYMAYISHHKLSLYLLAGLPIITARKAASAALVAQYGIGYAVDSLQEITALIAGIDDSTYQQLVANTRTLAQQISQGKRLGDALDRIEAMIAAETT